MATLADLRDLVADKEQSLSTALFKAKVLAAKLRHAGFKEWIEREMNGYPDDGEVPPYRVLRGTVKAHLHTVGSGHIWRETHTIPITAFPEQIQAQFRDWPSRQGVSSLEALTAEASAGNPQVELPRELVYIGAKEVLPHWDVVKGWLEIPRVSFLQLLESARSRLLDFILRLEDEMPEAAAAIAGKPAAIDSSRVEIIFKTSIGSVGSLAIGSPSAAVSSVNNDFDGLARALDALGVGRTQVEALRDAAVRDEPDRARGTMGSGVGEWLKGLAKSASAQVAEGATKAVMSYYGLPT